MNLQQLEYILAVDELRHFAKAAEYCNVTQPTLSAMIQKLEDELKHQIIRPYHPTRPTYTDRTESDRTSQNNLAPGQSD